MIEKIKKRKANRIKKPFLKLKEKQKYKILEMFYRTELIGDEVIVDNTDITIANELGVEIHSVSNLLRNHLNFKFRTKK